MEFIAIDFETANKHPYSACSLGLAIVSDSQIVDNPYWVIKPKPLEFSYWNIRIHGIDKVQVKNKPSFRELWPELYLYLNNQTLVAHYASFDMKVFQETLRYQGVVQPNYHYACSLKIARKVWPFFPKHGLKHVADYLGFDFLHHNAKEDAYISALIVLKAAEILNVRSLDELYSKLGLNFSKIF